MISDCFDCSKWPFINIELSDNIFVKNGLIVYEALLKDLLRKNKGNKLMIIFDLTNLTKIPPLHKIYEHKSFMQKNEKFYNSSVCKTAIIIPNKSWNFLLGILFSFVSPSRPNKICTDINQAIQFLNE